MEKTHNLEVPGSSPGWSTLKIKHLQSFCRCFFFILRTPCEHRTCLQTSHKHREILRTRFWCSQNTQSLFFDNNFQPSTPFFYSFSCFLLSNPHFGVRKWCSQGVLFSKISNTSRFVIHLTHITILLAFLY